LLSSLISAMERIFTMLSSCLLVFLVTLCHSYKILVYNPKFGHSNVNFYGNVADILVEAGHDVTTLLPQIEPSWGDGTTKSKKIYVPQSEECKKLTDILLSEKNDWFGTPILDVMSLFAANPYSDRFAAQCRGTLEQTELIDRLREEQFDVMIAENFDMCGIGLSHLIKPKALINGAASVPQAWMVPEFGLPKAWSYNPSPLISHLDVHSFWSRLLNIFADAGHYNFFLPSRALVENLFKEKYGPEFPSLTDISSHAAYTIVNSEPLVDFAPPTLNRIVYVGGLGAREPKKVDEKLDKILDLRPKTVLISFGSLVIARQLKQDVKNSIVATVARFPDITFIWKYEKPDDDFAKEAVRIAPNLHLFKWIPQNNLLADRRLTAFITHAGMGSTQEITIRGKPGLFIPVLGDQPRNAGAMERSGLGKVFDKRDLTNSDKFTAAVKDLLENESYYINARRIAAMIAKKPFSAREQLIKTVEFAAEFGASPALRPQSYDMTFVEYHNLDIILVFFVLITCQIGLSISCLRCIRARKSKLE
ncbi:hypothetical protein PRIPAC_89942, partial [Pristionchus pacificus]